MTEQKPCRCLLRDDASQKPLYEIVADALAVMPDDERTDEALYAARLKRCQGCAHLLNGTCALCGCYVELRAAKQRMRCPDVPNQW